MYKFNQRDTIKRNVPNFLKQYGNVNLSYYRGYECELLRKLDLDTVKAETINTIIGNETWARAPYCDECGSQSWSVV